MKSITKLQDGNKGIVFRIVTDDDKEQVIKFQRENPASAIVGAKMLSDAGVNVPAISRVKDEGLTDLEKEVLELLKREDDIGSRTAAEQLAECLGKVSKQGEKFQFPNVVRMGFASGESLGAQLKKKEGFKQIMLNPEFQKQLGQLIAADAFAGNGDRFFAKSTGESLVEGKIWNETGAAARLVGWFNPGNLIIEGEGKDIQLKAIDNEILPGMNVTTDNLFGFHKPGIGQYGSIAVSDPAQFKREIFAIAELMQKQAGIELSPQELKTFIENTTNSAKKTVDQMVGSDYTGEKVKKLLLENGETPKESERQGRNFEEHRLAMKMLSGNLKPENSVKPTVREAIGIAKLRLSDEDTKLVMGLDKTQRQRFDRLMKGERGDHVSKDFKLTAKEAVLLAKDESTFKQFTHKAASVNKIK